MTKHQFTNRITSFKAYRIVRNFATISSYTDVHNATKRTVLCTVVGDVCNSVQYGRRRTEAAGIKDFVGIEFGLLSHTIALGPYDTSDMRAVSI